MTINRLKRYLPSSQERLKAALSEASDDYYLVPASHAPRSLVAKVANDVTNLNCLVEALVNQANPELVVMALRSHSEVLRLAVGIAATNCLINNPERLRDDSVEFIERVMSKALSQQ